MRSQLKGHTLDLPILRQTSRGLIVALCLAYLLLQLFLLFRLPLSYDEGINLQVSRFIAQGYQPYTQIFTLSGPLFIGFIGWLGSLGLSVSTIKLVFALFGIVLLSAVAAAADYTAGRTSALAAVFLLGTATTFLNEVGMVVAIIPATGIALLSLVMMQRYQRSGQIVWLVAGGFISLIALFISISAWVVGVVTLLHLIFPKTHSDQPQPLTLKSLGLWLIGAVAALLIGLGLTTPDVLLNVVLKNHLTLWSNLPLDIAANFGIMGQFLGFNIWLFLFTVYGIAQLYDQPHHPLWLIVIWLALSAGGLTIQPTLRLVDAAILLPPMAIIGGWGLVQLAARITTVYRQKYTQRPQATTHRILIALCLFILYAFISYHRFEAYLLREVDTQTDYQQIQQRDEIAAFIDQHTSSDACVIIDDAALAIVANRLPTPSLVGLSEARLKGGLLTDKELATLIIEGQCRTIVFSKREYYQPFNDVGSWVTTNFPHEKELLGTRIYAQ
ncbi:MAG: hypothetical protein KDJ52_07300 [Anaerolineae bacterium]|nr:hypothetical protein [Anaerolineae bacterium]